MVKRKPLVSQHLENISREALEKYQNLIRRYVRRRQGVYALYRRKKLYYVGLASNLRSRLLHHLRDRHGDSWDRFSVYFTIGDTLYPTLLDHSPPLILMYPREAVVAEKVEAMVPPGDQQPHAGFL
jgi:hypothetical protein